MTLLSPISNIESIARSKERLYNLAKFLVVTLTRDWIRESRPGPLQESIELGKRTHLLYFRVCFSKIIIAL